MWLHLSHGIVRSEAILENISAAEHFARLVETCGIAFSFVKATALSIEPPLTAILQLHWQRSDGAPGPTLLLPGEIPLRAVSPGEHTFFLHYYFTAEAYGITTTLLRSLAIAFAFSLVN